MCLGIPGKVLEIHQQNDLPMGKVEFGGIVKEICLAYTPEAQVGDYVIVHVGFAISRVDEAEAAGDLLLSWKRSAKAGREPKRTPPRRAADEIHRRISRRRGGPATGRGHRAGDHAAVEHHGGLRRPDARDRPLRPGRDAAAGRSR